MMCWLILLSLPASVQPLARWRLWKSGQLIAIQTDDQLFRSTDGDFYVHVRVQNISQEDVGVDLKRPYRLVFPNQWTANETGRRVLVDERRLPWKALTQAQRAGLVEDFQSARLARLGPREVLEYFVRFNGIGGAAAVDLRQENFLVVSLDGGIWATDGKRTEALGRTEAESTETDRTWPLPVPWKPLPSNATLAPES